MTTTAVRETEIKAPATVLRIIEIAHDHDPAGVCWLCSDQVPWWTAAREKQGIALQPRLQSKLIYEHCCVDCGEELANPKKERCGRCALRRAWENPERRAAARERALRLGLAKYLKNQRAAVLV